MAARCYILCKMLLGTMPDAQSSQMNKYNLFVIPHLLWEIMEQGKGVLSVFPDSPRVGKVKNTVRGRQPRTSPGAGGGEGIFLGVQRP